MNFELLSIRGVSSSSADQKPGKKTMASSSKQGKFEHAEKNEDVLCYIHQVTDIKSSPKGAKYFNAILQTNKDEYHSTVVFNLEKHKEFTNAADVKKTVKLQRVARTLSKYQN